MNHKKLNLTPSFVKVPERLKSIKQMLNPDVLTFCAQNPSNGYPVIDPHHHLHIVSESGMTDKVEADINKADKERILKTVQHIFAVLPDDEYAVLHESAKKSKTPTITRVFTKKITKDYLASFDPGTLLGLLEKPMVNPNNGIEVAHFVPMSM